MPRRDPMTGPNTARWLGVVQCGYGSGLLLVPRAALAAVGGEPPRRQLVVATRVLGARQLIQATVGLAAPRRLTPARAATIDALHTASMVAVAVLDPRDRRVALASATLASLFATTGFVLGSSRPATVAIPPARRRDRIAHAATIPDPC